MIQITACHNQSLMKRLIILVCFAALMSCQDKVICPAFQSTYILDDSTRNAYFSYVWQLDESTRSEFLSKQQSGSSEEDTMGVVAQPKTDYYAYAGEKIVPWRLQKRTKYGIIKKTWFPIKNYQLRTAPMENVLGPEPVSNDFVASEFGDSLRVDSLSIAMDSSLVDSTALAMENEEAEEEKKVKFLYGYDPADNFNVEQLYYNKYFAEKFIDRRPEPTPQVADTLSNVEQPDSLQRKSPLKGLFNKKKKKQQQESEPQEEEPEDPFSEEAVPEEDEEDGG